MKKSFTNEEAPKKNKFSTGQAKKIGEQLGINWSQFDVEQFRMGLDVELEHGTFEVFSKENASFKEIEGFRILKSLVNKNYLVSLKFFKSYA